MRRLIKVKNKLIGESQPCFIVAEAGVNHNGSIDTAKRLIDAAKTSGADAVKFQIFIPEEIVSPDAAKADYQIETTGKGSQYKMLKKLALSEEEFLELKDYAQKVGIIFFATPHDLVSVDIIERLDLPIIKVASPDLNNGLLFKKLCDNPKLRVKPLFLSTGAGTSEEIKTSVNFLIKNGFVGQLLIYHCISAYPAPLCDQNLSVITTFGEIFPNSSVGFSDNTGDKDILKAAICLGAVSIETNITLDRNMKGPDHRISNIPAEFKKMVSEIRELEINPALFKTILESDKIQVVLGDGNKRLMPSEVSTLQVARKSIVASRNLIAGDKIKLDMLSTRRPMGKVSPMDFEKLISKRLVNDLNKGTQFKMEDVA